MEDLQKRLESLERQTEQLKHDTRALEAHTRTVERRLRCWRRMAYGLGVLGVLSLPLTSGNAQEGYSATKELRSLARRVEDLEYKLVHITSGPDDVTITGANLRIVNGLGDTNTTNGLGNLIVGYNEDRISPFPNIRTGSHNVVVGRQHNFSSFGGLVVAEFNEISGPWASVSGGFRNIASGPDASITGGEANLAMGLLTSVSGGALNTASSAYSRVGGGLQNTASGQFATVSGGRNRAAPADFSWVGGALSSPN
jgi:hypothetical protein